MIPVYIPTLKRSEEQRTLENLKGATKPILVIRPEELEEYKVYSDRAEVVCAPESVRGIALTRHWIGKHAMAHGHKTFLMMDDDLDFWKRDESKALFRCEKPEVLEMLARVEKLLLKYEHVGISTKEGNYQNPEDLTVNTRLLRALAFRTGDFLKVKHGRVRVMEDFDVALQILKGGGNIANICDFAQGQKSTNAKGGCSEYRTREVHDESACKLAFLHQDCVKLRLKKAKSGGAIAKRIEVTIAWKKAAEKGASNG